MKSSARNLVGDFFLPFDPLGSEHGLGAIPKRPLHEAVVVVCRVMVGNPGCVIAGGFVGRDQGWGDC